MATSGTVATTSFTNANIIEMAFRRAGLPAQTLTAEYLDIAKKNLAVLYSKWTNAGYQMWCLEKDLIGYTGQTIYTLPDGTLDIQTVLHRTVTALSGTTTTATSSSTLDLGSGTTGTATTFGIQPSTAGSYTLTVEGSNDNTNWTDIISPGRVVYATGEKKWYEADNATAYRYYRVREETSIPVSFTSLTFGSSPMDIPITVMNQDQYTTLPNKTFQSSRPVQYWFKRSITGASLYLWPAPTDTTSCMVVWRRRHIMDVGAFLDNPEVPQAWWDALVNGLAETLILDIPEADMQRYQVIAQLAQTSLWTALQGDGDTGDLNIVVDMSAYTE